MNKEFYSIGRGSLNLNGKFYYGLDYAITDFMRNMEQENANLKQALNEIKDFLNKKDKLYLLCEGLDDILEIIDEALKDE